MNSRKQAIQGLRVGDRFYEAPIKHAHLIRQFVIPAKAGIHAASLTMAPHFRENDAVW